MNLNQWQWAFYANSAIGYVYINIIYMLYDYRIDEHSELSLGKGISIVSPQRDHPSLLSN